MTTEITRLVLIPDPTRKYLLGFEADITFSIGTGPVSLTARGSLKIEGKFDIPTLHAQIIDVIRQISGQPPVGS